GPAQAPAPDLGADARGVGRRRPGESAGLRRGVAPPDQGRRSLRPARRSHDPPGGAGRDRRRRRRVRAMNGLVAGSAVVTGGGAGLGRPTAIALADGGAPVAVVDLFADAAAETVALVRDKGGHAIYVEADVSRWADVDHAVGAGVRELGPLG